MSVEYRLLHPNEQEAVLDLWVEVFPGTDRAQWEREFVWDPLRFRHTFVAVDASGSLLATIRYLVREVRGLMGEPYRTGWLTNVATRPNAQRRGHASQLLQRALDAMQHDGCVWSLLTADTAAQAFYLRNGWRPFPHAYRQGVFTDQKLDTTHRYQHRSFDPDQELRGWERLAELYTSYNAERPLTVVRDQHYWQTYGQMRLREWRSSANATIVVAESIEQPGDLVGYMIAHLSDLGLLITEAAAQGEHDLVIASLIQAAVDKIEQQGLPRQGRVYLPQDTLIDAVLQRLFGANIQREADSVIMVHSLAGRLADNVIDAIFAAPSALCWPLDDY